MKIASIILSLIIFLQSINIHFSDIYRLNELIEHAQFHKEQHGDNFFEFISKHYGDLKDEHHQEHQDEEEEHEQLPFQNESFSLSVLDLTFAVLETPLKKEEILDKKSNNFYYQFNYTSLESSGVFQPPRHA